MNLSLHILSVLLQDRLQHPLPGGDAHELYRAHPVGDVKPLFSFKSPPRPGGVLILLYEHNGEIKFPLIKRPEYAGAHSGQVSFPGGKAEPGEDNVTCALREAEEEIGISRSVVNVLGNLSDFYVMPSNFMITPAIGFVDHMPVFTPDAREVVRIVEGSVNSIIKDHAVKQKEILAAGKYRMMAPHFDFEGEVVWGATAMILNEFRMIVREVIGSGN
jgi:8-oxo-dGTP pyrophosphatase MutT (NUDIX family)